MQHTSHRGCNHPTPTEILRETALIRRGWSEKEHIRRYQGPAIIRWSVPVVSIAAFAMVCDDDESSTFSPEAPVGYPHIG
jgi:hypothetical protein